MSGGPIGPFASRGSRKLLRITGGFLGCFTAFLSGYLLFGHRAITALYSGNALPIVGRIPLDRSVPLGQCLTRADEQVTLLALTAFLSFFFYLLLVLIVRRLLRNEVQVPSPVAPRSNVRAQEVWWAFLVYLLVTVAYFYSVIPHLATQLIGPPGDNMQHLWDIWWARTALQGGLDFLHPASIYWPGGHNLLFHAFSTYNLILATTVGHPLPPVLAYNLLVLSTFVIAGVGAFLLFRHFTDNTAAALLGGFIFAFSPTHFAHSLHQIEIASSQFVPFFVLYYLKILNHGSKRNVAWASLFFLLNALCSWYYLVFSLFLMAACYGIEAYRRRRLLLAGPVLSSFVIVGVTLIATSPLTLRMLLYAARTPGVSTWGYGEYVIDLFGFLVPHSYHLLAGLPPVSSLNRSYVGYPWESAGYLGVLTVCLLLASGRFLVKHAARHVLTLLFFVALALGATPHLAGRSLPVALPYAAIQYIPVISEARAPNRAMAYAYLFLGLLVALAFSFQLREGFLHRRRWVPVLLTLAIVLDFWTPCRQSTEVRLPPAYAAILAQEPTKDFAVLDLPRVSWSRRARYMVYQTLHGFPIVQGYMSRKPSPSLLDTLEYRDLALQRAQLRSVRVKYIVVHKRFLATTTAEENRLDLGRYLAEYQAFFADTANLVLRVY